MTLYKLFIQQMPETTHSYFDFILHGSRISCPCVLVFNMWWKCTSTWSIFVGSLCTSPTLSSDQSFKPESRENHKLKGLLRERYWGGLRKWTYLQKLDSPDQVNFERPCKVNFEKFANSSNHFSCKVGKFANGQGMSSMLTIWDVSWSWMFEDFEWYKFGSVFQKSTLKDSFFRQLCGTS
jgi:hypothetical protein